MKEKRKPITSMVPKVTPKSKMKRVSAARALTARRAVMSTARKRVSVNNLTRKMGLMSIPKTLETKGTILGPPVNNTVKLQLSKQIVGDLKDIYKMSADHGFEIAGLIECTFDTNYANFTGPTMRTNYQRTSVYFPQATALTKITYHSHPSPSAVSGGTYVAVPSGPDFNAYVQTYRNGHIEANLILEQQGMYVVDVLRPTSNSRGESMFKTIEDEIQRARGFEYTVQDIIMVFNVDMKKWKRFINNTLDAIMIRKHGVSVRFYTWSELPTVRVSTLPRRT